MPVIPQAPFLRLNKCRLDNGDDEFVNCSPSLAADPLALDLSFSQSPFTPSYPCAFTGSGSVLLAGNPGWGLCFVL